VLTRLKAWLVLLLALILPLKGAVAAAGVVCHASSLSIAMQTTQAVAQQHTGHGAHHDAQHGDASHDPSAHAPSAAHAPDGASPDGAGDMAGVHDAACLTCSGICAASPLPASHALTLAADPPARALPAPARIAPPSHVSAGLDRPPRSV